MCSNESDHVYNLQQWIMAYEEWSIFYPHVSKIYFSFVNVPVGHFTFFTIMKCFLTPSITVFSQPNPFSPNCGEIATFFLSFSTYIVVKCSLYFINKISFYNFPWIALSDWFNCKKIFIWKIMRNQINIFFITFLSK